MTQLKSIFTTVDKWVQQGLIQKSELECRLGQETYEISEPDYNTLLKYGHEGWKETHLLQKKDSKGFQHTCKEITNEEGDSFYFVHPQTRHSISLKLVGDVNSNVGSKRVGGEVSYFFQLHPEWKIQGAFFGKVDPALDDRELGTSHELFWDIPDRFFEAFMASAGGLFAYAHVPREGAFHKLQVMGGPYIYSLKPLSWFGKGNQDRKNHLYVSQYFGYEFFESVPSGDIGGTPPIKAHLPISSTRIQVAKEIGALEFKLRGQLLQDMDVDPALENPTRNTEVTGLASLAFKAGINFGITGEVNWARERPLMLNGSTVDHTIYKIVPFIGGDWNF